MRSSAFPQLQLKQFSKGIVERAFRHLIRSLIFALVHGSFEVRNVVEPDQAGGTYMLTPGARALSVAAMSIQIRHDSSGGH